MSRNYNEYNEADNYRRDSYGRADDYVQTQEDIEAGIGSYTAKVFGWMFFGILLTAACGFAFVAGLSTSPQLYAIASQKYFFISLIVAEVVAVIGMSFGINKINSGTAKLLFLLYAAINGVTLSYICLRYAGTTVTKALIVTALFFGIMALYGHITKSDLARFGPILLVGLICVILASIINFLMKSPMMDYVICIAGLGIFAGLTAYDTQKIKKIYYSTVQNGELAAKMAIFAALALYLDFVNMFIYLLRLFGNKD